MVPVNSDSSTTRPFAELPLPWRACIEEAWTSFRNGSLPIGAVVVDADGTILARGRNRLGERHAASPHLPGTPYLTGNQLAHAEVNALLELGPDRDPPHVRLYTTTEPCPLCMGAARMSSVAHVAYASRDPWAGCANMADGVPYLALRGPTIEGPVAGLEDALVAWQVVRHLGRHAENPHFLSSWESLMPVGCAAGRRLAADGSLQRLAEAGADAGAAWTRAREVVEEACSNAGA